MIKWILDNMDMLNIIAAWVGAITGVVGLLYSIAMNKATLKISNCFKDRVNPKADYQYGFELVNTSNVSIVIKSIQLFDTSGKEIFDNGFDPNSVAPKYINDEYSLTQVPFSQLSSYWDSEPFENETDLFPNSSVAFSYYLDRGAYKIKVTTNKRIHFLSKTKSFFPIYKKRY
ncbi:hypothetical protein [Streptococcus sp. zg-JUN1979]|uniref:hypothetical protein n=1 Tax=Streptococcus sp. zg-JUN1979 TaxID=3391450 RepID=UPI0039A5910E